MGKCGNSTQKCGESVGIKCGNRASGKVWKMHVWMFIREPRFAINAKRAIDTFVSIQGFAGTYHEVPGSELQCVMDI